VRLFDHSGGSVDCSSLPDEIDALRRQHYDASVVSKLAHPDLMICASAPITACRITSRGSTRRSVSATTRRERPAVMIGLPTADRTTGLRTCSKPIGVVEILTGRGFRLDHPAAKVTGNIHFEEYW
jgi:hypothetical protein